MSSDCIGRGLALFSGLVAALAGCAQAPERTLPVTESRPLGAQAPLRAEPGLLVAHALGSIAGIPYTNSLEAFECNYARGHRWFEVDLALTSDDELFCFHEGREDQLGLLAPVQSLTANELEGRMYGGRYPLLRFSQLLEHTDRLGDVVLVTDTKYWSERMLEAFRRIVRSPTGVPHPTRLVLQSYGSHDIGAVKTLSRELGGDIILTLYMTDALDEEVQDLATKHAVVAVVADQRRFSPWLADRLHEARIPILIHTINDHEDVMSLTDVGADGFFTDHYRPYELTKARAQSRDCALTASATDAAAVWRERRIHRQSDYKLSPCAERRGGRVHLASCEPGVAIRSAPLSVPPHRGVHVVLEAEADEGPSQFWLELAGKNRKAPVPRREQLQLAAKERKRFEFDAPLTAGSAGFEVRLGLASRDQRLSVHGLSVSHDEQAKPVLAESKK